MSSEENAKTTEDSYIADQVERSMMMAVFNLCYMKYVVVASEQDRHLAETNCKSRSEVELSPKIEEREECGSVAQKLLEANQHGQQHGLLYGNYVPPHNLPPVPSNWNLIGICSKPFEKLLTPTDLNKSQSRLAMSKEHVQKHLIPLLNGNEDLKQGIQVTTYDMAGKEYRMVFKIWASKIHVLTGSAWNDFCNDHNLVELKMPIVTVWMFRNIATGNLCFVIKSSRFEPEGI